MKHKKSVDTARDLAKRYYAMFLNSRYSWEQDLKARDYTDEEILQEFIETAYWYGYTDAKMKVKV